MTGFRMLAALVSAAVGPALITAAQAPAPAPDPLASIRSKTSITNDDQTQIAQWINDQIQAAMGNDPPNAHGLLTAFRDQQAGASDAFKQALALVASRAFRDLAADSRSAKGSGAIVCAIGMRVLGEMNLPVVAPTAVAALAHPTEAVREQAARCLLTIAPRLDAPSLPDIRNAVRAAARKENGGEALRAMYALIVATMGADEAANAILDILGARLDAYKTRDLRGALGDAAAVRLLGDMAGSNPTRLSSANQAVAVRRLAELLKLAVLAYLELPTDPKTIPEKQNQRSLEVLIDATEKSLTAIAEKQRPGIKGGMIASRMMQGGDGGRADMLRELNNWIGTGQKAGILNAAPFNLPPGLPDVQPAATQPAATAAAR